MVANDGVEAEEEDDIVVVVKSAVFKQFHLNVESVTIPFEVSKI